MTYTHHLNIIMSPGGPFWNTVIVWPIIKFKVRSWGHSLPKSTLYYNGTLLGVERVVSHPFPLTKRVPLGFLFGRPWPYDQTLNLNIWSYGHSLPERTHPVNWLYLNGDCILWSCLMWGGDMTGSGHHPHPRPIVGVIFFTHNMFPTPPNVFASGHI